MGQYYMVYTKDKNGKEKVYDRSVDGEYTMAKLMEHSWWNDPFTNTMCYKIHHKPTVVAWVGDYSEDLCPNIYETVWGDTAKLLPVTEAQVQLFHKYLVNHTKKTYLDCNKYYNKCHTNFWCVHPLPLLTAIGNGYGGGDYCGINEDKVGIWAMDKISVEEKIPKNYTEFFVEFKEE